MEVTITKEQALAKLQEVANEYENMVGVELTDEDALDLIRYMGCYTVSLDIAAREIVEGILKCLCLEIA